MPWAPLKACSQFPCPEKLPANGPSKCPKHLKAKHKRIDERRGSAHARGYDAAWSQLRIQAFIRDGWHCVQCGWEPDLVRYYRDGNLGLPPTATMLDILRIRYNAGQEHLDADHIIPFGRRPELRLVLSNLQTMCSTCHKAKSRNEMMEGLNG